MKDATLKIYDVMGNVVFSAEHITSNTIVIDKGDMPNGYYLFELVENGKPLSKGKFVIAQ